MIPFDFAYYKPASAGEAVYLFHDLQAQGKNPFYYGGGTEIISFSRLHQLYPQAVIDVKDIPECRVLEYQGDTLVMGAAVTLSQIQESNFYPLLSWCGGRVADHTIRDKITLGGNICARIPYREAILALLVADCQVVIEGKDGTKREPLDKMFDRTLQLEPGDLLVQVSINKHHTNLPFYSSKRTTDGQVSYPQDRVGYPLISSAFVKDNGHIRAAFSGLCAFPFRSFELENALCDRGAPLEERLDQIMGLLPGQIVNDMEGSGDYRAFLFRNTVKEALGQLEGVEYVC
ncbi:MAG: xanthine dehydrogenase [Peptococcaceae bacterium]|nr:xanthine dehydrogenase [Candidatus Syntrophopropionicum ammoniitolerans]